MARSKDGRVLGELYAARGYSSSHDSLISFEMGRLNGYSSGSRSHRSSSISCARSIPDLFKSQPGPRGQEASGKMAQERGEDDYSEESHSSSEDMGSGLDTPDHPLTFSDMTKIAADI